MNKKWEVGRLDEICEVEYGTRVVKKRDGGSIFPVYGGGGATFKMDTYNRENRLVIGRFAMSEQCTRFVKGKFFLNDSGLTLNPRDEEQLLPEFLNWQILSINDYIYSLGRGTAQKNLDIPAFRDIEIKYVLPLSEQKRIVSVLDKSFDAIEKAKTNAEENLENSRELFKSSLNNIFTNPGEDWEQRTLGEVSELINRGISPKYIEKNGIIVLNQKCIRDHKISFEQSRFHDSVSKEVKSEKMVRFGDVLINSTGTGTLGRVAQVKENLENVTVDSHVTIVRPMRNMFFTDFFGWALIFIEDEIAKRGQGCGGQTELARSTLKEEFSICFPKSFKLQEAIVQKLDALFAKTRKLEVIYQKKANNLEEMKKSLLQKAFHGEL